MTRRLPLVLMLVLATACSGGGSAQLRTPTQRLHAAVRAAQAVYDPDSAGGTGYGTTAGLVRRIGPGPYGTPRPWPDDLGFRPGVVYVGTLNGGRLANLWVFEPSGRALIAIAGAPHRRVSYRTRSHAEVVAEGLTVIRPGVVSGDMIRSALERAGFAHLGIGFRAIMADRQIALVSGYTERGASRNEFTYFAVFRTAAQARRQQADAQLPPIHLSVVIGTAWIAYSRKAYAPDRSTAFSQAVEQLRREARTE